MIIRVTTETGSIYEFDPDNDLARRVSGEGSGTARFQPAGMWKQAISISEPEVGKQVCVTWPDGQPELRDNTITSVVTNIENLPERG